MNAVVALELLIQLTLQLQKLAELIKVARAENRDITDAELDALAGEDDLARAALKVAIDKAKAEGR